MAKKHTFEFVKSEFESHGLELLESEYKGNKVKLKFRCPIHPDKENYVRFNDLIKGTGCKYCGIERRANSHRYTFQFVKDEFSKSKYILLENEYIDSQTKMRYQCPDHPEKELCMTWNDFQSGRGCPFCAGNSKLTLEEAKERFIDMNYILLENEYKNSTTKMMCKCIFHLDIIQYKNISDISSGYGCPHCAGNNIQHSYEFIKSEFERLDYTLLEDKYVNNETHMKYICNIHPDEIQYITYNRLQSNDGGCYYCCIAKRSGENHYAWKSGVKPINSFLRQKLSDWNKIILESFDYKCDITNQGGTLVVHHLEPFYSIRDKLFSELNLEIKPSIGDYSEEELIKLENKIKELHTRVKGVPLKEEIHKLFHHIYGHKNISEEYYYEFKQRYLHGEFKNLISA